MYRLDKLEDVRREGLGKREFSKKPQGLNVTTTKIQFLDIQASS